MSKRKVKAESLIVSVKPRLHKAKVISRLSVGQVIAVGIAHTYQKGYGWSDYSEGYYKIEKLSRKEIVGRSEKYKHDCIKISREDLDCGYFELRV
jgi:hypothetical protein